MGPGLRADRLEHRGVRGNAHASSQVTGPEPTVFVIFGAAGDLSWRKLIPALYSLFVDGWLPEKFRIIGTGHRHMSDEEFRQHLREGVDKFSRRGKTDGRGLERFAAT